MAHDVISACPVCAHDLTITRLQCRTCGTSIEGEFTVGRFGRLDQEQLALLESFLRSRGNLREMERELRLSYPTVRGRVEAVIRALGFGAGDGDGPPDEANDGETDVAAERRTILERLARHEIDADDAATAIRALGRV